MPSPTAASHPQRLTACLYNVGFGECILLTFHYAKLARHILAGFGSVDAPRGAMLKVAEDIRERCGGKLHAVLAANPRPTHTSGFATDTGEPGRIIRACKPDLVIQPWVEDPQAARGGVTDGRKGPASELLMSIASMGRVVEAVLATEPKRADGIAGAARLKFLLEKNRCQPAIRTSLRALAPRSEYLAANTKSRLETVLPGVRVHVLGPLAAVKALQFQNSTGLFRYRKRWEDVASAAEFRRSGKNLFPRAPKLPESSLLLASPVHDLQKTYYSTILDTAREIDQVAGNLSVVLFLEAGSTGVLLPGDALIESWSAALNDAKTRAILSRTRVYKVGAHGSMDGTPRSLWGLFGARSTQPGPRRLVTLLSTKHGRQGSALEGDEVPNRALVEALTKESDLIDTRTIRSGQLAHVIEVELA